MKVVSPQGVVTRLESYAYNSASEVLSHTVDGVTTSYSYDASSQLTAESRPGYNVGYTFDGNRNRLTKTVNGVTENYTYDNGDKLLGAGQKTYQYDAAGRTTRINGQLLTYDDEDRLKTYLGNSYTCNGMDTRISSSVGGVTRSFHRDGSGVTAPMLSDDAAIYTPGTSERRNGVTKFMHSALKDNGMQSNASGQPVATRVYDAYGAVLTQTGSWSGPLGFGGKYGYQEDNTGLQLLGHRYYNASTGRFITRDPIKDGRNWYSYCDNNPVTRVDANGLDWHDPTTISVSPDFKGKVWVVGELGPGDSQVLLPVLAGSSSRKGMDVDIVIIQTTDSKGRVSQRRFVVPGAWSTKVDGQTVPSVYSVDKNGNLIGVGAGPYTSPISFPAPFGLDDSTWTP